MKTLCFFLAVLLVGCSSSQQSGVVGPADQPEVVSMTALPPFPMTFPQGGLKMNALLHVMANGTVGDIRLLGSSGSVEWDSASVETIRQWKFNPARQNGVPVDTWFKQALVVQPYEPTFRYLGELVAGSQQEADSLFKLIKGGMEFEQLAHKSTLSAHDHGGYLGAVDLAVFPDRLREEIKKLKIEEITPPLRVGDKYVIYKRFEKNGPKGLHQ